MGITKSLGKYLNGFAAVNYDKTVVHFALKIRCRSSRGSKISLKLRRSRECISMPAPRTDTSGIPPEAPAMQAAMSRPDLPAPRAGSPASPETPEGSDLHNREPNPRIASKPPTP